MDKRFGSPNIANDFIAQSLIKELENLEEEKGVKDGIVYYDFPIFRDEYDNLSKPDVVLASKSHGLILFSTSNVIQKADLILSQLDSIIYSKLVKSKILKKSKREIIVIITSVIYATESIDNNDIELENNLIQNLTELNGLFNNINQKELDNEEWMELISLIEGGKGIIRPVDREVFDTERFPKAAILSNIEKQITNFDKDQ